MESRRVSKNIRFRQKKKKKIGLQLLATDEISHRSIREYFYKVKAKVSCIRENNLNIFGTIITILNLIINFNLIILLN